MCTMNTRNTVTSRTSRHIHGDTDRHTHKHTHPNTMAGCSRNMLERGVIVKEPPVAMTTEVERGANSNATKHPHPQNNTLV